VTGDKKKINYMEHWFRGGAPFEGVLKGMILTEYRRDIPGETKRNYL
jgi:hypothetical protein